MNVRIESVKGEHLLSLHRAIDVIAKGQNNLPYLGVRPCQGTLTFHVLKQQGCFPGDIVFFNIFDLYRFCSLPLGLFLACSRLGIGYVINNPFACPNPVLLHPSRFHRKVPVLFEAQILLTLRPTGKRGRKPIAVGMPRC
jgi:hypothetical protein